MKDKKAILIFGGGTLQISIIKKCKRLNFLTVVIDPFDDAPGRIHADFFEVVGGEDFEKTCEVVVKYSILGVITAATDKPLIMMARIADKYKFPFFSLETAIAATDKYLMKLKFQENNIPCAKGFITSNSEDIASFPVIIKPRDNSGSRGVFYCNSLIDAKKVLRDSLSYSKLNEVLIEEVIEGSEYSIESIHYNGITEVIQYTEKLTTNLPYNVELGHIQPASLTLKQKEEIANLIGEIANALKFDNCASHTELKINDNGIFIIESSPRLGGDFITSNLIPISTGIDIEELLINISMNIKFNSFKISNASVVGVFFLNFESKMMIDDAPILTLDEELLDFSCTLKKGDVIPVITNSIDRYGYFILKGANWNSILTKKREIEQLIESRLNV